MATLPRLNTSFFGRIIAPPLESAFLCDRFWDVVFLETDDESDDGSVCCNDEDAYVEDRTLNAFDKICKIGIGGVVVGRQVDHFGPADNSMEHDNPLQRPARPRTYQYQPMELVGRLESMEMPTSLPVITTTTPDGKALVPRTGELDNRPSNGSFHRQGARPMTPQTSISVWASSFRETFANPGRPKANTPRPSLPKDDDVRVFESDVLVDTGEDNRPTMFWNAFNAHSGTLLEKTMFSPVTAIKAPREIRYDKELPNLPFGVPIRGNLHEEPNKGCWNNASTNLRPLHWF